MNKGVQYLRDLVASFFAKNKKSTLKQRLVKGAAGSFGLRITATILNFLTGILLARLLGASGFGVYTYAFTWTQLLTLGSTLGLDNLIVREVAIYRTKSFWSLTVGLLRWANQIAFVASVIIALSAIAIVWVFNLEANGEQFLTFCMAMALIPIDTLRNLRLSAMRGLHKIVMGLVPEWLISPMLLLIFTGCAYLLLGASLNAFWVSLMRVLAALVTLAIGIRLLSQVLPDDVTKAKPQYKYQVWLKSALPFMFMGSMYMIKSKTDLVMLGAMQGAKEVGIYFAVSRGAQLIEFVINAANGVLAPNIASLYAEGKIDKIQRVLIKSSRSVLLASLPIIIALVMFGHWYLSLFGREFVQGKIALIILCIGQLTNVMAGSLDVLLNMTGNERYTLISRGGSTVLNVILNALLIPKLGLEGAAIATTSSAILMNVENTIWVRKKLGIYCTAFGKVI